MASAKPAPVKADELYHAFLFVSSGLQYEYGAYICRDTGGYEIRGVRDAKIMRRLLREPVSRDRPCP